MRLRWEGHDQSQDTNWRHRVTGPELPFFHKRKGVLKIDQSVKMPWHKLSMGVACSCSSAPASVNFIFVGQIIPAERREIPGQTEDTLVFSLNFMEFRIHYPTSADSLNRPNLPPKGTCDPVDLRARDRGQSKKNQSLISNSTSRLTSNNFE